MDLFVPGANGIPMTIKSLEVVGVTQALTSSTLPALWALLLKADKWIQAICTNFLLRTLLWVALHHVIWPLLCYP